MPKSPRDNNLAEMPARFVRRVDDKRTLACIVAERHVAAHPHALLRLRQVTRHRSAASRAEPTGIRLFGCARHRGKLRRDRSYSHALLGRRRGTANKTFSSSRQSGAGLVKSPTIIDGIPPRKSGSHQTRRWRGTDSNPRSPIRSMDANTKIAVDREQRGHRSAGKWRNADLPQLRDLRSSLQAWPLGLGRGHRQQQRAWRRSDVEVPTARGHSISVRSRRCALGPARCAWCVRLLGSSLLAGGLL
jgi:hypothetical protein